MRDTSGGQGEPVDACWVIWIKHEFRKDKTMTICRLTRYVCRLLGLTRPRSGYCGKRNDTRMHNRDRFDKFTERARKVLRLAQEEARRLNHHYIGTEHLLLGLLREGEGIGAGVLESFGLSLQEVRAKTIKVLTDRRNEQHDEQK
jgi:hypothetical protein